MSIRDLVVFSVIIPDEYYTLAAAMLLERLFRGAAAPFSLVSSENKWICPVVLRSYCKGSGGFGLRCFATMPGDDDCDFFSMDYPYKFVLSIQTPVSFAASQVPTLFFICRSHGMRTLFLCLQTDYLNLSRCS